MERVSGNGGRVAGTLRIHETPWLARHTCHISRGNCPERTTLVKRQIGLARSSATRLATRAEVTSTACVRIE